MSEKFSMRLKEAGLANKADIDDSIEKTEFNNWPRNLTNNFPLQNCIFDTVKLVRNAIKIKTEITYNG